MGLLVAVKRVYVSYQDGSRERYLKPGEKVPAEALAPRAIQEHIARGEFAESAGPADEPASAAKATKPKRK